MFKYSIVAIIVYWVFTFSPLLKMIINKQEINDNVVVFLFTYVMIPLFIMAYEYAVRVWK